MGFSSELPSRNQHARTFLILNCVQGLFLNDQDPVWFPDPALSNKEGLVAVSETLGTERLILAYQNGIFHGSKLENIHFGTGFSPDPRFLLFPKEFKISRSLKKAINENLFEIRINQNFRQTIQSCAQAERPDQESTWIENDMIEDYCKLNELGIAHSIEAYYENKLVGGLYGLHMGSSFFGESMFYKKPEASKVCLSKLVELESVTIFILLTARFIPHTWKKWVQFKFREIFS